MFSDRVTTQLLAALNNQISLLFALSVAICGGIIALTIQVRLHRSSHPTSPVEIRQGWWMTLTFITQGASLLFGYLASGAITDNLPSIYKVDLESLNLWSEATFDGFSTLTFLMAGQFWIFLGGVLCLFFLLLANK